MILAFYFNTAIDQQIEKKEKELARKLSTPRWEAKTAARSILETSLYAKLAQDMR